MEDGGDTMNVLRTAGRWLCLASTGLAMAATAVSAADPNENNHTPGLTAPPDCPKCAVWTLPQEPFQVYGNTYYVGTQNISSILVTSPKGHILIDGTVQESAPQVAASIRALGFRVEDVRLILNTHVHYDHAGGIALLQKLSGAEVAASASSAHVLSQGRYDPDDPLYADRLRGPTPVNHVRIVKDGEILKVGPLSLTAHFTPGHTTGGTSWTWVSCEKDRCLSMVYADSLSPVSADEFRFSHNTTYPNVLKDFESSFGVLSALPCDILLTPHPEFSDVMGRLSERGAGRSDAFINPSACRQYVEGSRTALQQRLAQEANSERH
jgi:metallo-beta-lactamase class B